jgi:DNA-binding NarL/FixJ family response regulator
VILADDHRLFREGVRTLLQPHFDIVGLVEDGRALLAAVRKEHPDVILVDISMPRLNGIESVRQIKRSSPQTKVVFVSMHHEAGIVAEALRAGASGYVLKNAGITELAKAIAEALKGRVYLCPRVAKEAVDELRNPKKAGQEVLSPRQREVVQLISEGHILKDIAAIMNISVSTVEFHKQAVMRRLGANSTADLVKYAVTHGITQA